MSQLPSLRDIFQQHSGRLIDKWDHYFAIYERHFSAFRQRPIRLLEIGVSHGGSLQLWKQYFGDEASIVGVDIDPRCREYAEDGIDIEIGDQGDPAFWARLLATYIDFDIVIDDGSHLSAHQLAAFANLWPRLRDQGVYLVEDCHCAYWPNYGGGFRAPQSFIEFAKARVDDMNAFWSNDLTVLRPTNFTAELGALTFHDSIVVFEKQLRTRAPARLVAGVPSHPLQEAEAAILMQAHIGSPRRD